MVVTERRIVMVAASGAIIWDIANEPGPPDYTLIQIYSLVEPRGVRRDHLSIVSGESPIQDGNFPIM